MLRELFLGGFSARHRTDIFSSLPAADPDDLSQTLMSFQLLKHSTGVIQGG